MRLERKVSLSNRKSGRRNHQLRTVECFVGSDPAETKKVIKSGNETDTADLLYCAEVYCYILIQHSAD